VLVAAITLKIQHFNPPVDSKSHIERYTLDPEPSDRGLDLLNRIKWYQDGTLTYRGSCTQGICGSDAM
jgi:succinate dehydrogenase iron-sulfur subunit